MLTSQQRFFSTNLWRPQNKQTRNPFILLGPALLFLVEDMFGLGLRALLLNPQFQVQVHGLAFLVSFYELRFIQQILIRVCPAPPSRFSVQFLKKKIQILQSSLGAFFDFDLRRGLMISSCWNHFLTTLLFI